MMCAGLFWHLILLVTAACTLRFAVVFSVWLHEAAHLIAAAMPAQHGSREVMTGGNITGISVWALSLSTTPYEENPPLDTV